MKAAPRGLRQSFGCLRIIVLLIACVFTENAFAAGGDLDDTFEPGTGANGDVRAIAVQPDGKIIIVGSFTSYNPATPSLVQSRIVRINPDGSRDTSFIAGGGGANDTIFAVALQADGKIIIGGAFTDYNGTPRNRVARLHSHGDVDMTFDPGTGATGTSSFADVRAIAIQADNKIIIGGLFTSYSGTGRNRIARLETGGALDTSFDPGIGASGSVFAVAAQSDGKIVIGGAFSSYNSTTRNRIARLSSTGALDMSFDPGEGAEDGNVFAVAVQSNNKIVIGGLFSTYHNVSRNGIARINTNGTLDTTFDPGTGASSVHTVALQSDGKVIIGSSFTSYNGVARNGIARANSNGSLDTTFDPGTGVNAAGFVYGIGLQPDGKMVIGGSFTSYNNVTRNRVARLLPAPGALSFSALANNVNEGAGNATIALARTGGTDNSVTAQVKIEHGTVDAADYIFAPGALDTTFEVGSGVAQRSVNAVAVQPDGKIIIGGDFLVYNGVSRIGIARLHPNGSVDMTFNPGNGIGLNTNVFALALQPDGKIIIGGSFITYQGFSRIRIARLNANATLDMTFDPGTGFDDDVRAIALQADGKIIVGGEFVFFRDAFRTAIARLNADGSLDTTFLAGEGPNDFVRAIAIQPDAKILIAGDFFKYGNVGRNRIARISLNGTLDTTFDPGTGANSGANDGDAYAVAVQTDGRIILGGEFTTFNGTARNRIAGLNANGSLDMTFDPGTGANQSLRAIRVQPDGKVVIGGFFSTYNDVARSRLARLNPNGSLDMTFDPGTGLSGHVRGMALQDDGKIPIGGAFSTYDGASRASIARVNGDLFVNWPGGDSTDKSIQLPIVDDVATEGDETLNLTLTNFTGGATSGADTAQVLTIVDNEAVPTPTPEPTSSPEPSATSTPQPTPAPSPDPGASPGVLGNIATRLRVETGDNVLIGGFIVTGNQPKKLIVRAIGPSSGVPGALANPLLELYVGDQVIAANDNWRDAPNEQEIIDSTVAPSNDLESAILLTLDPGPYTAVVSGVNGGTGVGVVEAYDLDRSADSTLANIATRGLVRTGDDVMIGGLIVLGETAQKVIVRAIGPSLGIAGQLENPLLQLFDGNGNPLAENNDWKETQQEEIEATTIPPPDDLEAAIVTELTPAAYTAIVRGMNDTTGVALVEVYALD